MGVCTPDMNSCTPKCKVCTGPNAGSAYDCANPCGCFETPGAGTYSWNGTDCVKPSPCSPYNGTSCIGGISIYWGVRLITYASGPAATTLPVTDSTPQALALIGTQATPYSSFYLEGVSYTGGAGDPQFPPGYSWVWRIGYPGDLYGGTEYRLLGMGDSNTSGIQLVLADQSPYQFGFQGCGIPVCLENCCGCTPCSLNFGCPGAIPQLPSPAPPGELYGDTMIAATSRVVVARWTSGPNAATSVWTRIE